MCHLWFQLFNWFFRHVKPRPLFLSLVYKLLWIVYTTLIYQGAWYLSWKFKSIFKSTFQFLRDQKKKLHFLQVQESLECWVEFLLDLYVLHWSIIVLKLLPTPRKYSTNSALKNSWNILDNYPRYWTHVLKTNERKIVIIKYMIGSAYRKHGIDGKCKYKNVKE